MIKLTIDQALQQGIDAHKAGRVKDAERLYTAILEAQPKHPDANHNMGVLAVGVGKAEQALPLFRKALEANPAKAQFWLSYIDALIQLEKLTVASAALDQARFKGATEVEFDRLQAKLKQQFETSALKSTENKTHEISLSSILRAAKEMKDAGKLTQAVNFLHNNTPRGHEHAEVYSLLSHIHLLANQLELAKHQLDIAKTIAPNSASVGWNTSRILLREKNAIEALSVARTTSENFPNDADGMVVLGACYKANNNSVKALKLFNAAIELNPKNTDAYLNRGTLLLSQGNKTDALWDLEIAYTLKPHVAKIWEILITLLLEHKKYAEALSKLAKMIESDPLNYRWLSYQAQCFFYINDFNSSIHAYKKALSLKPGNAQVLMNFGLALKANGDLNGAVKAYEKAIYLKPDLYSAYNNLGIAQKEQGNVDEAIACFEKSLEIKSDLLEAWINGADTLEKSNRIDQLETWLQAAIVIFGSANSNINLFYSKLFWRKKDVTKCLKILSSIEIETLAPERKEDFLNLKGKALDSLGHYSSAHTCFDSMNILARSNAEVSELQKNNYLIEQELKLKELQSLRSLPSCNSGKTVWSPVFLVSFPRSGTTLLDTILRSHASINVVEEQPMVDVAKTAISSAGHLGIKNRFPNDILVKGREAYSNELTKHACETQAVVIDKLPLNIFEVPLIHQMFPQAKFIFAIRHPLDSILSCWMQNFKLNPAMACMSDLTDSVKLYCIAMEIFKRCRSIYNLNVLEVRYEDLIEDCWAETLEILNFLELEWDSRIVNYQNTALKRGLIRTPSYSQVVQPIYKSAKNRWRNYEKYLDQYIPDVDPWIREFGYANR